MDLCFLCCIKKEALLHILILPDQIKVDADYFENIYKSTREKLKEIELESVCESCKNELKVVQTFRQNCLNSEELMQEISSNIADNHRVLIENVYIDVTLFEGIDDFYVHPINVIDKKRVKEPVEGLIGTEAHPVEAFDQYCDEIVSDAIIYDPVNEVRDELIVEVTQEELEKDLIETDQIELNEESKTEHKLLSTKSIKKPKHQCDKCKKEYRVLSSLDMHRWKRHKIPLPERKRRQKLDNFSEKDLYFGLDLTKTCEYCFNECNDNDELKIHLDTLHQELPRKYTCRLCPKEFKTRETIRMHHLAIHTDERREHKCQHCEKVFFYKRSLQTHEEIQHLGIKGTYICDICGQKSNSRGDLNRHKLRHDKIKAHECPHPNCGKRFTTKYQLTLHKRYHDNIRSHKCTYCDRSFVAKCALNDHLQCHLKEKKYFCDHCSNSFSRKRSLDKHLKVHYGIRDFLCNICPYKCRSTDQLKQHKKVHEGFRPFSCLMCSMAFKDIGPLKRHLTISHGISAKKDDDLDYERMIFITNQEVVSHVRFRHTKEKKYPCEHCNLRFVTSSARLNHMRVHTKDPENLPFKCPMCPKSYAWRDNLDRHTKVHSDKKDFVCEICNASFHRVDGLSKHLRRIHSNAERPHKCQQCSCSFNDASTLKRHLTIYHKSK